MATAPTTRAFRKRGASEVNNRELKLAATVLEMASDKFSNHGCNDFDLPESWTQGERDEFTLAMDTWNGSPEDHQPGRRMTQDCLVMSYLAAMLKDFDPEVICGQEVSSCKRLKDAARAVVKSSGQDDDVFNLREVLESLPS